MNNVLEMNDKQLETELAGNAGLVLVDFWAPWCGPCRRLGPILEQLSNAYQGKLKVIKINVDRHQAFASALKVAGIPALFFFKNGRVVQRVDGLPSPQHLVKQIESLL